MSYARRDDCDYTKILRNVKKKRKEFSKKPSSAAEKIY